MLTHVIDRASEKFPPQVGTYEGITINTCAHMHVHRRVKVTFIVLAEHANLEPNLPRA